MLQPKVHIFLHERELDVRGEEFELSELLVGFGEDGFLVLFAAEGEEGAGFVASAEVLLGDFGFAGGYDGDFLLVLVEFVALVLEVEDGSGGLDKGRVRMRQCYALILR